MSWRRQHRAQEHRSLRSALAGYGALPRERWTREYFENLGLSRLRGTIRYPAQPFWKEAA